MAIQSNINKSVRSIKKYKKGKRSILTSNEERLYHKFEKVRKQHNRVHVRGLGAEKIRKRDFKRAYETYVVNNGTGKGFVDALLKAQIDVRFQTKFAPAVDLNKVKNFHNQGYTFSEKAVRKMVNAYNKRMPQNKKISWSQLTNDQKLFNDIFNHIANEGYWYDLES